MNSLCCIVSVLVCIQVYASDVLEVLKLPDYKNIECVPQGKNIDMLMFNKVEILNKIEEYPLTPLLAERGMMPEEDPDLNNYLYCIWKKEGLLVKEQPNYDKLEKIISDAIVMAVGRSGPAVTLSNAYAKQVVDECKTIKSPRPSSKVAKVQNHIISQLEPFTRL